MRALIGAIFGTFVLTSGAAWANDPPVWRPVVESEQVVYRYRPADNGASPMWCHGSTCLVRIGDDVWATGLETIPNAKPLNNCRWTLWQRHAGEWKQVYWDEQHRTREPSPLVGFPDGRLLVSATRRWRRRMLTRDRLGRRFMSSPPTNRRTGRVASNPHGTEIPISPSTLTGHSWRTPIAGIG